MLWPSKGKKQKRNCPEGKGRKRGKGKKAEEWEMEE